MANRYWVGGAGTWNTTSTTNWSTASGGASGASVPTAADSVFFDQAGTYTVTCTGALACNDFTVSAGTVTFQTGTSPTFTIAGSVSIIAGTNYALTAAKTFTATSAKTITTNGVTYGGSVTFDGVGGSWTLGSALNISTSTLTVTNGTFDTSSTGNYSVTAGGISSSNSNTRTINLNASTITVSGNIIFTTSTNLTLNAGTSQINCSSTGVQFQSGGLTFYNVSFTSTINVSPSISGTNTFNNLSITGRTSVGIGYLIISANQTINGTLTVSAGTASSYRIFIFSDIIGTTRTLTCAAVSLTDVDFRDISIAGAASPASGTRLGDCKGNSGITFPAAKTVYYRQTGSANWGATGTGSWSATSGGALDATQFPLAQDTAIFPAATYPASGATTNINDNYNIGTIDMSLRTSNTMTLATSTNLPLIYGNWINGTGITLSGTGSIGFRGRTTQQITSAGKSFTQPISINSPSGSVTLQDAMTTGATNTTTLTNGTLDLQSFTLSTGLFNSSNSNTRTIAFGTGNITCTGTGTVWTTSAVTGLTTTGTQVVNVTSAGSTAITVAPGSLSEANSISYNFTGGTYALTFFGTGSTGVARNVDFTGYAGTWQAIIGGNIYGNLKLSTGMTLTASTNALVFGATSGTQQITTNGKTLDFPLTFNGVGGTFQLQDALTMGSTRIATLTNGTLDLNNFTLVTGIFSSDNSNTRSILFGTTGLIFLTATTPATTVLSMATAIFFTFTGTSNISAVMSVTRTFNFGGTAGATTSNRLNINTTAGASVPTFTGSFRQVNFTGSSSNIGSVSVSCHGFTLSSAGTYSSTTFLTVGSGTLTYVGKSVATLIINATGITTTLADAGQNSITTLIDGTLNLAGYTLTNTTRFATTTGTKNLTFNGGTLLISGAGVTAFNNAVPTGFTTTAGTGTGVISMTAATAKTFVGGGSTFNCTLNQGGAGALTIEGSNTFSNITNTVQPASVLFTAGTTSTFSNFSLSGTSGNLITIGSVTAASHTLSKASGTVSVSFCSISRSNGTGGATWEALTTNGNVDGGNNTGWNFGAVAPSTGNFLVFF